MQQEINNIKNINYNKYDKVLKYLRENASDYTDQEILYIINNTNMIEKGNFIPSVFRQIYDELGFFNKDNDLYEAFVDLLDKNFDIDSNIVEVGGGVIPSIAKKISSRQVNGTITVYDPRLSNKYKSSKKFILKKEKFSEDTDINKADLIIGFMPCEATELLIKKATNNKKDFFVALCEGRHNPFDDYFDTEEWTELIYYIASRGIERNSLGELEKTYLKDYGDPYPLIYNKRKKLK